MLFVRNYIRRMCSINSRFILGLEIASSSVSCVVMEVSQDNYQCRFCTVQPLTDNKTKLEVISSMVSSLKLERAASVYCVLSISDSMVNVQWIRVDRSELENIDMAVSIALTAAVALPLEELYFDYQVFVNAEQSTDYVEVLIMACKRVVIDARFQWLKAGNLIPLALEVNSSAIKRAYLHLYTEKNQENIVLVHISTTELTFLLFGSTRTQCYSEFISERMPKETLAQTVQNQLRIVCLLRPTYQITRLCFLGAPLSVLDFLAEQFAALYRIKTEILMCEELMQQTSPVPSAGEQSSANLLISFGLALHGLHLLANS